MLLAEHPWVQDTLVERGSSYLARARTVPHELTIDSFAESEGQAPDDFVDYINQLLDRNARAKA